MSEFLLNQFEQDRALVALRYKNLNIRKLFGKSVFIAGGGELAFSLVSSLRMVNIKKQAGIAVFLLVDENEKYDRRFDCINSSDFSIVKYSSLDSVDKSGDILIETGFSLPDRVGSADVFKKNINRAKNIISAIKALKVKETVLLSDASAYGKLGKDLVISEKEKTHSDFSFDSLKAMLIQSVENLYFSASHMYDFSIKSVRCGKIISADSNSDFVKNMLESAVHGKTLNVKNKSPKVSYISINDLISAVLFVLCNGENSQVYNACSDDSTVNSAEFALAFSDAFEKCVVNITSVGDSTDGCAIDCTRLKKLGWSSMVNYKDALLISGHEVMNDDSVFMFSDSYDGKLNDIQQILLGFLLEVDRICKKHPKEFQNVFQNLDTYKKTLDEGVSLEQAKRTLPFIHNEKNSLLAIDQRPPKGGFQLRLYIYPHEQTQTIYVITIGDKQTQQNDIKTGHQFIQAL